MTENDPLLASQLVVRVCLFIVAAIAMFGGTLQMYLSQPDISPRLDNVHRFMAGVYFSTGLINLWAAITIRQQRTLVYLPAAGVLLAGIGRLASIRRAGSPSLPPYGWAIWFRNWCCPSSSALPIMPGSKDKNYRRCDAPQTTQTTSGSLPAPLFQAMHQAALPRISRTGT